MPDHAINESSLSHPTLDRSEATRSIRCTMKTVAIVLLGAMTAIASNAQTFTNLYSFDGANGAEPQRMALVQGIDGNFYGVTPQGGNSLGCASYGCGTVFKISSAGTLTTLYDFCSQTACTDGSDPYAGLIQAIDGNFYGTTSAGGTFDGGTVFKFTPAGALTTIYSFNGSDGNEPLGAVVQGPDGNLYGTTLGGGAYFLGTVFRVTPAGVLTTLHSFDITDGFYPFAGLFLGVDGYFYGTTALGGTACSGSGCGVIFRISPAGAFTVLHSLIGYPTEGSSPYAGVVQGRDGSIYGTTTAGGSGGNCQLYGCGTVFKITQAGAFTTLHNFNLTDGQVPNGLMQATDGTFYGATYDGGASGDGLVFKVTANGAFNTLFSFDNTNGRSPFGGLLQATNGSFYGTTGSGGADNDGTVFSLATGLAPFVEPRPASGKTGARVIILGTNLTGTTAVTFNGTPATFTATNSAISTTVPVGATSGTVTVTTPSGTLSSNVIFRVRP